MLSTTEETLEQTFSQAAGKDGCIERVKKLKDYAFIHFRERVDAIRAMDATDGSRTCILISRNRSAPSVSRSV